MKKNYNFLMKISYLSVLITLIILAVTLLMGGFCIYHHHSKINQGGPYLVHSLDDFK